MKRIVLSLLFAGLSSGLRAQQPLYIVNGAPREEIASIPPDDIETIDELPADEESIARYGERASNGVIIISLKYDTPARFEADSLPFEAYVARRAAWADDEPAARVVVRYTIAADGTIVVDRVLESTESRLRRRVLKVLAAAPPWIPATKNGRPIESSGVLRLQLPEGKPMPGEPYLRIR